MSFDRKLLEQSNAILRRAEGDLPPYEIGGKPILFDGAHPRYQWKWSEELLTAMPLLDSAGNPKMEYICGCGTDKAVHSPDCKTMTVAVVKFAQVKIDPFLPNCFALCQWTPPPSHASWEAHYGSFRYYPDGGRYRPISTQFPGSPKSHYIMLPYPRVPLPGFTEKVIEMIKDHYAQSAQRMLEMDTRLAIREMTKTRDVTPPPGSNWAKTHDFFADKMTLHGEIPGKKGSVSYPGQQPPPPSGDKSLVTLPQ